MALRITQDAGIQNGFVFQGTNYEGGVCNALEYIWTHGGDVLSDVTSNKVVIDSPEAAAGLATYASMITERRGARSRGQLDRDGVVGPIF